MARLIPADKGTHFVLCALVAALLLVIAHDPLYAAAAVLLVAGGREVYGWNARGRGKPSKAELIEAGLDIAYGLAGGATVLVGVLVKV